MKLTMTKGDQPNINTDNIERAISAHPPLQGIVWFDTFHDKVFTIDPETKQRREWCDNDDVLLMTYFQRELGITKMSVEQVRMAVNMYARKHKRNEPKDWLESLKHDGVDRLSHFFERYYGTDYSGYTHKAGMNFWVGMIARIYRPGCKNDHMIVLEGPQGVGKSRSLEIIGGDWYAEASESIQSGADFYMTLQGKILIEFGELDSFGKAEVTKIKQIISCSKDRYRGSYDRRPTDHPRQGIFAGSTNEDAYLRDTTGGRRFWPIITRNIDIQALTKDRDQLFAQAVLQYKQDDEWWIMPGDETREVQESRRQRDEWEQAIEGHTQFKEEITITELAVECLKVDLGRLDKQTQMRIANVLRALKWTRSKTRRGDRTIWAWRRPLT
jgi:putative DNA primase/helicase